MTTEIPDDPGPAFDRYLTKLMGGYYNELAYSTDNAHIYVLLSCLHARGWAPELLGDVWEAQPPDNTPHSVWHARVRHRRTGVNFGFYADTPAWALSYAAAWALRRDPQYALGDLVFVVADNYGMPGIVIAARLSDNTSPRSQYMVRTDDGQEFWAHDFEIYPPKETP